MHTWTRLASNFPSLSSARNSSRDTSSVSLPWNVLNSTSGNNSTSPSPGRDFLLLLPLPSAGGQKPSTFPTLPLTRVSLTFLTSITCASGLSSRVRTAIMFSSSLCLLPGSADPESRAKNACTGPARAARRVALAWSTSVRRGNSCVGRRPSSCGRGLDRPARTLWVDGGISPRRSSLSRSVKSAIGDLCECHGMLNAFFPCITLKCKEYILSTLSDRRELEEVTRDNNLVAVSMRITESHTP
ncbi:hypothetical protein F5883DRAFT_194568 [Diaporthe sp. PMI_573]|nr:hypothetical protein F5883DRAFT_194568 [Diaporthaceae sp. PMI_573]